MELRLHQFREVEKEVVDDEGGGGGEDCGGEVDDDKRAGDLQFVRHVCLRPPRNGRGRQLVLQGSQAVFGLQSPQLDEDWMFLVWERPAERGFRLCEEVLGQYEDSQPGRGWVTAVRPGQQGGGAPLTGTS